MPPSQQSIHLLLRNREKVLFEGDVFAVSSVNSKGVFDILPGHINFISIIKDSLTIHNLNRTEQKYEIKTGIIRVRENNVEVYVGLLGLQDTKKQQSP